MDYYKKYIKYKTKYTHLKKLNKYSSYGGGLNELISAQLTKEDYCIDINSSNTLYVPMKLCIYESSCKLITSGLNICTGIFFSVDNTNYGIHSNLIGDVNPPNKNMENLVLDKLVELSKQELKPTKIYIIYSYKKDYNTLQTYCTTNNILCVILEYGIDTFNIVGINKGELIDCEMALPDIYKLPNGNLLPGSLNHSFKQLIGKNIKLTQEKYKYLETWTETNKFTIINIENSHFGISIPGESHVLCSITKSDIEQILPSDNVAIPPP